MRLDPLYQKNSVIPCKDAGKARYKMSKNSINPIGGIQPVESGSSAQPLVHLEASGASKPGAPAQTKVTTPTQVDVLAQVDATNASKPAAQPESKPAKSDDEKSALPVGNGSDITIHFRVDEDTKDLTVFVVDRKSKRVLRSIPANELNKLSAGDLLKLTA
jgi:uncharacterized FlaG/YvyC family protein